LFVSLAVNALGIHRLFSLFNAPGALSWVVT